MDLVKYYKDLLNKYVEPIIKGKLSDIENEVYNDAIKTDIKSIKGNRLVDKFIVEKMIYDLMCWYTKYLARRD